MSVLTNTTRVLALLAEAEDLLSAALREETGYGDPDERDIRSAYNAVDSALRAAREMFRGDQE